MLSRLREHFGTAGLIVAIVALSIAVTGGAIAASGDNDNATASAKAKKGPRGPKGPKGDTGPPGPAGPAGPQGAKGDNGAAGANGKDGTNGNPGATGPQGLQGNPGATGSQGLQGPPGSQGIQGDPGVEGPPGPDGPAGSPWSEGGTLPPGATQTGTWAGMINEIEPGFFVGYAPITFAVPLEEEIPGSNTINFFTATPAEAENCENSGHEGAASTSNPEAKSGFLCVYPGGLLFQGEIAGIFQPNLINSGASVAGAVLELTAATEVGAHAGTFAVTG